MAAVRALARRGIGGARVRDISFGLFYFLYSYAQVSAYRSSYPSLHDRLDFAKSFADNKAIRLFYGVPHDLASVGGYAAWRVGGLLAIFTAAWGLLSAVKLMRAEEDAGRQEVVLAGPVGRRSAFLGALAASAGVAALLAIAVLLGFVAAKLAVGESALLALGIFAVAMLFVGIGALASQIASTRRLALELGGAAIGLALLLRIVAGTSDSLNWLSWLTPFGWLEEMRAFAGSRPAVLLLPAVIAPLLLLAAFRISLRRDVGEGILRSADRGEPDMSLLSSPTTQALRGERVSLLIWVIGTAVFALVIGVISDSVSSANVSESLQRSFSKVGGISIATPSGYLSLSWLFFVLVVSLFACAQIAAARHEEGEDRVETLIALPVGRRRWLGGRLVLAVGGAVAISMASGLVGWIGAASAGVDVSLADMLGAGANCLPAALLFLGVGALAYAVAPRASTGIAYGLVLLAFVWQLFGSLLDVPAWTLDLSPFHHVGLVPEEPFKATAAVVMLAIAGVASAAALTVFRRRDLITA